MTKQKILLIGIFILIILGIFYITPVNAEKPESKKTSAQYISSSFTDNIVVQTEVDPDFPCELLNQNQIICHKLDDAQIDNLNNKQGIVNKLRFFLFGIPIKNEVGRVIKEHSIRPNKDNIIDLDLSKTGKIKIGFDSNVYEINSIANGVLNQTIISSGSAYLSGSNLTGTYDSEIFDLNQTKAILNMTYSGNQPPGSSLGLRFRSFNISNSTDDSNSLIGYWKLDSSNVLDFSGNNITGTKSGDAVSSVNGKYSNAYYFDGSGDFLTLGDPENGKIASQMTASAWVYIQSTGSIARIVSRWGGTQNSWQLFFDDRGTYNACFQVQASGGGVTRCYSLGAGNAYNQWHLITGTWDGTTLRLYVDGIERNSGAVSGTLSYNVNDNTFVGKQQATYYFKGYIDEVALWNRTLSGAEVGNLSTRELRPWADWSSEYTTSPSSITVPDGRFVQFKTRFTRLTTGEVLRLDNVTIGYDTAGTTIVSDNLPSVTLVTADATIFTTNNVSLNFSATDDIQLKNASLWGNWTGTWHPNLTTTITGTSNATFFNLNLSAGTYLWNVQVYDNSTALNNAYASANRTFTVSTACVDSSCPNGFVCNTQTNQCYTSCNSHTNCNATSYCNTGGSCSTQLADTLSCQALEFSGLADNNICTGAFCFDDSIGTVGEFCTDASNGCVNDGTEYASGNILCAVANDFYQCTGGESSWGSLVDCQDLSDPTNAIAKTSLGHTYCSYYSSAQSCSTSLGCTGGITSSCSSKYFFNDTAGVCGDQVSGVTDAIKRASCDVNCGASYDLETCPSPNTLGTDCNSCTPPAQDNPPEVTLVNPATASTQTNATIIFQYDVSDENPLQNCSLYFNTTTIAWHLNQSNSSAISRIATNSFPQLTLSNGAFVTWNVLCYDNASQSDFASVNFTFTINTAFSPELTFGIYNNSETNNPLFSVTESGDTNITRDATINRNLMVDKILPNLASAVEIPKLLVSDFLDIVSSGLTGIRISNPFNEYIKFQGKSSGGNILFGLFQSNPLITTSSGNQILTDVNWNFTKSIDVKDNIYLQGNITKRGTNTNMWIDDTGNLNIKLG